MGKIDWSITYCDIIPGRGVQHYVIKFVSDLRQVGWFPPVSSTNKTDRHDITEILLTMALNTIKQIKQDAVFSRTLFIHVHSMEP